MWHLSIFNLRLFLCFYLLFFYLLILKLFFNTLLFVFGSKLLTHFHVSIGTPSPTSSHFLLHQVVLFPIPPVPCPRIESSNLWYEHVCLKNAAFICILSQSYPSINQTLLSASTGCTRIYAATL